MTMLATTALLLPTVCRKMSRLEGLLAISRYNRAFSPTSVSKQTKFKIDVPTGWLVAVTAK